MYPYPAGPYPTVSVMDFKICNCGRRVQANSDGTFPKRCWFCDHESYMYAAERMAKFQGKLRPRRSQYANIGAYYEDVQSWMAANGFTSHRPAKLRNRCRFCGARVVKGLAWCAQCRDKHHRQLIGEEIRQIKMCPRGAVDKVAKLKKLVELWPVGAEFKDQIKDL